MRGGMLTSRVSGKSSNDKSYILLAACQQEQLACENAIGGVFTAKLLEILNSESLDSLTYAGVMLRMVMPDQLCVRDFDNKLISKQCLGKRLLALVLINTVLSSLRRTVRQLKIALLADFIPKICNLLIAISLLTRLFMEDLHMVYVKETNLTFTTLHQTWNVSVRRLWYAAFQPALSYRQTRPSPITLTVDFIVVRLEITAHWLYSVIRPTKCYFPRLIPKETRSARHPIPTKRWSSSMMIGIVKFGYRLDPEVVGTIGFFRTISEIVL